MVDVACLCINSQLSHTHACLKSLRNSQANQGSPDWLTTKKLTQQKQSGHARRAKRNQRMHSEEQALNRPRTTMSKGTSFSGSEPSADSAEKQNNKVATP